MTRETLISMACSGGLPIARHNESREEATARLGQSPWRPVGTAQNAVPVGRIERRYRDPHGSGYLANCWVIGTTVLIPPDMAVGRATVIIPDDVCVSAGLVPPISASIWG